MMCINFDDAKKRCQEARCDNCKYKAMIGGNPYEPLLEIDGLGINH